MTERLRVLIVGAGRRVQNNFLPALKCLESEFTVAGIHARSETRMLPLAKQWNVPAIADLNTCDFSHIDVVAISVPTDQNANVLRQLLPHASQLRIVIDTPIFRNARELAACEPLLKQFKEVRAAEDFMNFPPYILLRRGVEKGLIGKPERLTLLNTGYLYHGLALIRSLTGFAPALGSSATGGFANQVNYRFMNGYRAAILGPYRQYEHGGIVLEGSKGVISQVAGDSQFRPPAGKSMILLSKHYSAGTLTAFRLTQNGQTLDQIEIPNYGRMQAMDFEDKSELNLLRGCGLIEIFQSLISNNINTSYTYDHALYDSMVSRLAERRRFPLDPLAYVGLNAMMILRPLANALRRT